MTISIFVCDPCHFYQLIFAKVIFFPIENNNWLKSFWEVERFPPLEVYCESMVIELKKLII